MLLALPASEADGLRGLRGDLAALRARVVSLRDAGGRSAASVSPSALHAAPCARGSSRAPAQPRSTLSRRHPLHAAPAPHDDGAYPRPDVPASDRARIATLAPLGRRVRGGTPASSPLRRAKDELDALVVHHYHRGVSIQRLAELAGVTFRAMSVRLHAADPTTASTAEEYVHASTGAA